MVTDRVWFYSRNFRREVILRIYGNAALSLHPARHSGGTGSVNWLPAARRRPLGPGSSRPGKNFANWPMKECDLFKSFFHSDNRLNLQAEA
jgi:hypothetical protein